MCKRLVPNILHVVFLLTFSGAVFAQEADSLRLDTVKNKFLPTGIRIGTDVFALAKARFQDNFTGWEVAADVDFNRYLLAVEMGNWGRNFASDSSTYRNSGNYWRVGIDVNFLTKDPDRNVFFLGGRYGKSVFTESMTVMRHDPVWGLLADNFYHSDVNANWIELTAGLKVKIWKVIWLGYTARFKFALSADGTEEMMPADIPGFGRTDSEVTWGFNYNIMVRLPIRKATVANPVK